MTLNINGNDYELHFGIGFVRELDKKYFAQQAGIKFGIGIETKVPMLLTGDVLTLAEFIYLGTSTSKKRPTVQEIDQFMDSTTDIEGLFDEVIEQLKKQNATKIKMKEFQERLNQEEVQLKKAEK